MCFRAYLEAYLFVGAQLLYNSSHGHSHSWPLYICGLTIALSSPVTPMLSTIWLSSLLDAPHKIRSVLVLTHISFCSVFFEP